MTGIRSTKITPFLWFNDNAHEAIRFYTSIFKNSRIIQLHPMVSTFELEGQRLMAINGGPQFKFTEAVSLYIDCNDQTEVDYYWNALLQNGGTPSQCGWLKDKFGLSWQIIPKTLSELMSGPDAAASERVMQAMLKMVKIDVMGLQRAHDGK